MNLPNYITLGRIVVVPLLVVVLLTPAGESWFGFSGYALAIVIFLIAALTDIVDGQLARRRNESRHGTRRSSCRRHMLRRAWNP